MNRIKEVLEAKGIKQEWLAEQLGKSYKIVNSYAQNKIQPSFGDLSKIAEILNIEANVLLVKKKKIEVVAAIIHFEDKILCVQRPESKLNYISKKFEFPGGKTEEGETRQEALERELIEELDIKPLIKDLFLTIIHTYPDFEITMHSYTCVVKSKELKLKEHISALWLKKDNLSHLDWAAADLPIVAKLIVNE